MSDLFEPYPASAEALRGAARKTTGAGTAVRALVPTFEARHRAAASETTVELGETARAPLQSAGQLTKGALWAASQVELFADAIDTYNDTSTSPRSIRALNAAWNEQPDDKAEASKLKRALTIEKAQLDKLLDQVAAEVASSLGRSPSDVEVQNAWRAGNLPVTAVLAWPELNLNLSDPPAKRIADDLAAQPDLDPRFRQLVIDARPDVLDYQNKCLNTYGRVQGPDGRMYDVVQPFGTKDLPPGVAEVKRSVLAAPDSFDGEWRTIATQQREATLGDSKFAFMPVLFGVNPKLTGPQSIGNDQESYIDLHDGGAYIADGTEPPPVPWGRARGGPSSVFEWTGPPVRRWDTPEPPTGPTREEKFGTAQSGLGALLDVAERAGTGKQIDNNRHYLVETVFQEDAQGNQRAIINMYQAVRDGSEVGIKHYYGQLQPDGTVTPIP